MCLCACFHVLCLDLCFYMLISLDLHALGFMPCFLSFVLSLLCVDVRVMCSHARCHVYGYALLRSMCSYAFCHVLCLDPHPYMLICLDLCVHMVVCLDLCSIFFMPSFMCLCALCHVCVPRPRLCLSCHVLL